MLIIINNNNKNNKNNNEITVMINVRWHSSTNPSACAQQTRAAEVIWRWDCHGRCGGVEEHQFYWHAWNWLWSTCVCAHPGQPSAAPIFSKKKVSEGGESAVIGGGRVSFYLPARVYFSCKTVVKTLRFKTRDSQQRCEKQPYIYEPTPLRQALCVFSSFFKSFLVN